MLVLRFGTKRISRLTALQQHRAKVIIRLKQLHSRVAFQKRSPSISDASSCAAFPVSGPPICRRRRQPGQPRSTSCSHAQMGNQSAATSGPSTPRASPASCEPGLSFAMVAAICADLLGDNHRPSRNLPCEPSDCQWHDCAESYFLLWAGLDDAPLRAWSITRRASGRENGAIVDRRFKTRPDASDQS